MQFQIYDNITKLSQNKSSRGGKKGVLFIFEDVNDSNTYVLEKTSVLRCRTL